MLARDGEDRVSVVEPDGRSAAVTDVAGLVAGRPDRTRWVWDDTEHWYAPLLAAGVRVERCVDLRLCRRVLRRSPLVDQALLDGPEAAAWDGWDDVAPVAPSAPTLFSLGSPRPLDAAAQWQRQQAAVAASDDPVRLGLLLAAESASALVAAEMTHAGLPWRADVHDDLLTGLLGPRPQRGARPRRLDELAAEVRAALGAPTLDPDSPTDLLAALQAGGLPVTDTRGWALEQHDHPAVAPVLAYKKLSRLWQAHGWTWLDTWVADGRFRARYRPSGVPTGRWSSHGGGALSLPVQVRPAVVADPGWRLVVADTAQLEPRCLAAMSGDRGLADAARGTDLYQALVDSGAVPTRSDAKLGMLGALYGGVRGESGRMVDRLTRHYPTAFGLVEQAARTGEAGGAVSTWLGRGSPPVPLDWPDPEAPAAVQQQRRRARGRFTRNFVVQGTGAELAASWLALLRTALFELGADGRLTDRPHLVFFLHDEVVVHTPEHLADATAQVLRDTVARAGRVVFGGRPVDFPVTVAVVTGYDEVHKPGAAPAPTGP